MKTRIRIATAQAPTARGACVSGRPLPSGEHTKADDSAHAFADDCRHCAIAPPHGRRKNQARPTTKAAERVAPKDPKRAPGACAANKTAGENDLAEKAPRAAPVSVCPATRPSRNPALVISRKYHLRGRSGAAMLSSPAPHPGWSGKMPHPLVVQLRPPVPLRRVPVGGRPQPRGDPRLDGVSRSARRASRVPHCHRRRGSVHLCGQHCFCGEGWIRRASMDLRRAAIRLGQEGIGPARAALRDHGAPGRSAGRWMP